MREQARGYTVVGLGPLELLVILIMVLLLFGPKRLPEIGRALGQALREFREMSKHGQKPFQEIVDSAREALSEPPLLVFVSSIMDPQCEDLRAERVAAKKAIEAFPQLTRAWRFEDSPASPETAGRVYLNKVKECDIFVLVLGEEITRPALREYATARKYGKPRLVFLKRCERTSATQAFVEKIRKEVKYVEFNTSDDLDRQIWIAVATFLIQQARRYNLTAHDIAVLMLFLEQLPKVEPMQLEQPPVEEEVPRLKPPTPVGRVTGMDFARYWVDYAERYGGSGKGSYKTYDRLEGEWANLEVAANWLWEKAGVQGETVGDKDAARMLVDLACALKQFLWFGGRWDERVQLSARAYEAACAMQDWSSAGWGAYYVARIHFNRARTDDAALWADRCAEAWARGGSKSEQATATDMRGLVAWQRKDYDEAERLCREALSVWRNLGLDEDVAMVLNSLGGFARKRQDYDAAERHYREGLDLARKIDNKDFQATLLGNLGELAHAHEQWAEARQLYEQELALAREVGRLDLIAGAQSGLARVWEAEGRADLALPLAQEALRVYERLQHRDLAEARELVERLRGKQPPP
jgi:TatA/E family protein of Tat protein translocase